MTISVNAPDALAAWLEQAGSDPSAAGPPPSADDLLGLLESRNPNLANVVRYLRLSEQLATEEPEAGGDGDATATALDDSESIRRGLARNRLLEALEELRALRARNDSLAAALGACHRCWGDDTTCETCRGEGAPGSRPPHLRLFDLWVTPALREIQRVRREHISTSTEGAPA